MLCKYCHEMIVDANQGQKYHAVCKRKQTAENAAKRYEVMTKGGKCKDCGASCGATATRCRPCATTEMHRKQKESAKRFVFTAKVDFRNEVSEKTLREIDDYDNRTESDRKSRQAMAADNMLHRAGLNMNAVRTQCKAIRIALGKNNTRPKIFVP